MPELYWISQHFRVLLSSLLSLWQMITGTMAEGTIKEAITPEAAPVVGVVTEAAVTPETAAVPGVVVTE
jgi:hypothetical protein